MKLKKLLLAALTASTIGGIPGSVLAGTEASKTIVKEEAPAPEKGAPLPLHQIEGNGGVLTTLSAHLLKR
jgi:hypothetical protein